MIQKLQEEIKMKLNIYKRKDGRFEGRLAVGKKLTAKFSTNMFMLIPMKNAQCG